MKTQSKHNQPLVSIVMPVYNAGDYIVEAIESILKQTYKHFELIIVDDRSIDNSWNIIQRYAKKYPLIIKAIRLKKNTNAAGNGGVNAVYPITKGKYIARMDADDISHPTRIEKQVRFMENHTDAILVGTQGYIIDQDGQIKGTKIFATSHQKIYEDYFVLHPILHPSIMIRKSLVPTKTKLYENKRGVNDDYYTFFKLLQYGKFYNLSEKLLYYRIHGANFSLQNPKKKFYNSIRIRLDAIKDFNYTPTFKGLLLFGAQLVIIPFIPESLIVPLYFLVRGIKHPSLEPFYHLKNKIQTLPIQRAFSTAVALFTPLIPFLKKYN